MPAMRLTGYSAIEYAEKHNLTLSKHGDAVDDAAQGLTVPEAEAIAEDDEELVFLDIAEAEYASSPPTSFEPDR
jgi:hypothetical protein